MSKLNVCVLFGGKSGEHEVSVRSVQSVVQYLDKEKYNIHMIKINKNGSWVYEGNNGFDGECPAIISPDSTERVIVKFTQNGIEKINIDVVFPVLHGKWGEDGTVQGLLELADIPYVGSGVLGSALCMDKCIAKMLFKNAGIPQADWVEVRKDMGYDLRDMEKKLGYPCFVKPSNAGSSVGVSKAKDEAELIKGITAAFEHDNKVLIEKSINGREIECSILGNDDPKSASVLGEVVPVNEFYDYNAKYIDEGSALIIPADISEADVKKIKEYAIKAYKICECKGFSRVDFFVDKDSGEIYINEINTIPGFTSISMYPKLWEASGLSYKELIDKLIDLAVKEHING